MLNRRPTLSLAALLLGAAGGTMSLLPATPAAACGGFFCNRPQGPVDVPIAQTGENVLFAMERGANGKMKLEAHIQIFYTGPADRFSWVLPVDDAPTLAVGSNRVFQALDAQTRPRYGLRPWTEEGTCKPDLAPAASPGSAGTGGSSGRVDGGLSAASDGGVQVAFRGDVGPYDAAVVKSDDPMELLRWLEMNKYFVSPEAARLIADYVKEQKYFVAVRLLNGAGVNEILPLVLKFDGPSPCVPLKLTAIAALRDLRVNLWVLAQHRVVPSNFFEIKLNAAKIDWFNNGRNYDDLVKRAADEAGGQAFITEYAGASGVVRGTLYREGQFKVGSIAAATTPPAALSAALSQGLTLDAALLNVLRTQVPMPAAVKEMNVTDQAFYGRLQFYWDAYRSSFAPFDAKAFAAAIDEKIVQPLARAEALFEKFPKLTRLATFISPEEMTLDPLFVMNPTLPDVPRERTAQPVRLCGNMQYTRCMAPVRLELDDGQKLLFNAPPGGTCFGGTAYDRTRIEPMPALAVAYRQAEIGEGKADVDNRERIEAAVTKNNAAVATRGGGMPFTGVVPGTDVPNVGPGPSPLVPGSAGAGMPPMGGRDEGVVKGSSGACAVAPVGGSAAPAPLLALAGAITALARRRRRR